MSIACSIFKSLAGGADKPARRQVFRWFPFLPAAKTSAPQSGKFKERKDVRFSSYWATARSAAFIPRCFLALNFTASTARTCRGLFQTERRSVSKHSFLLARDVPARASRAPKLFSCNTPEGKTGGTDHNPINPFGCSTSLRNRRLHKNRPHRRTWLSLGNSVISIRRESVNTISAFIGPEAACL